MKAEATSGQPEGSDQPLVVQYTLTFRDYLAFSLHHFLHSPLILTIYGLGFAIATYVNIDILSDLDGAMAAKFVTFLILEAVLILFQALFLGLTLALSIISRRNKTVLTEHTITLTDAYLTEETAYNRTEQKWAGVQKIARTKRHLFIYIAQHLAHVIPRRAFTSDSDWDSFRQYCRDRMTEP